MIMRDSIKGWKHKLPWRSNVIFGVLSMAICLLLVGSGLIAFALGEGHDPPWFFYAGTGLALIIAALIAFGPKRYVWLLEDGVIKGLEFSSGKVLVVGAIRFSDVSGFYPSMNTGDWFGFPTGFHFAFSSERGWFRGTAFGVVNAKDAATALHHLMLHIDPEVWDPELEDWAYGWLREQGKHLDRISPRQSVGQDPRDPDARTT